MPAASQKNKCIAIISDFRVHPQTLCNLPLAPKEKDGIYNHLCPLHKLMAISQDTSENERYRQWLEDGNSPESFED